MEQRARAAAVAGSWYPSEPGALSREIEAHLAGVAGAPPRRRLVGLISPHAGLRYSGPVAAYGYALLRGLRERLVVLVGPSHHVAFEGLALPGPGPWNTPLGNVPVDDEVASQLLATDPLFFESPAAHRDEHSLEMQLPFLAHLVPQLRIVPILMGCQSRREVDALVLALARALADRSPLLVASSDLSHFHPAPEAGALDAAVRRLIERYDDERLMQLVERSGEHACGGGPMVAVMKVARALGATQAAVLRYADSGDVPPRDKNRVVGYLSAALFGAEVDGTARQ